MNPGPDEAGDCQLLFVYGTLRRGGRLHHHLARTGARFQSEAKVAAELFDLGSYPGARPVQGKENWVCGELFELQHAAHDLEVLDQVEDYSPSHPEHSEYIRALAKVILPHGEGECSWIYWLSAHAGAGWQPIAGGDYAAWLKQKEMV